MNTHETNTPKMIPAKKQEVKPTKVQTHIPRQASLILEQTARKHGLLIESLLGDARYPDIVTARAESYARLRDELGYSYSKIASLFGRNHSGVLRAIRTWEKVKPTKEVTVRKPKDAPPKTRWEIARQRGSRVMARKLATKRQDARVQAIDVQIRKAEQYGQEGEARALRGHRWRVKSGV